MLIKKIHIGTLINYLNLSKKTGLKIKKKPLSYLNKGFL